MRALIQRVRQASVTIADQRVAEIGRGLLRFFFHMPGGFTHTMPLENVIAFYEACREYGRR